MKNIIILGTLLLSTLSYAKKSLKSHVHGHVKLSVAVDKKQIFVELEGPSESFLGFEHRPKTAKEKASWKKLQSIWKNKSGDLFSVPNLNCTFEKKKIALVFEEEDHDDHGKKKHHDDHHDDHHDKEKKTAEHSEIKAEMYIVCKKMVSGSVLNVSLKREFVKAKEVDANVLLQSGKFYKKEIEKGQGTLAL
ncbi:MAG: DUF2796 domain-containing protein [Bdellovibrionota bacterium]|nr:DUF2796 domain-containing protein [Bdellovibrionota bacterium]